MLFIIRFQTGSNEHIRKRTIIMRYLFQNYILAEKPPLTYLPIPLKVCDLHGLGLPFAQSEDVNDAYTADILYPVQPFGRLGQWMVQF